MIVGTIGMTAVKLSSEIRIHKWLGIKSMMTIS